ncbi:unnamed protein product [Pedinophyceae sp. YPF-701]|nr:unnamed protein product [Pedinophyceae sp. YPF-701]
MAGKEYVKLKADALIKQVHPPTAISHAITAFLTAPSESSSVPELVCASATNLEIYRIVTLPRDAEAAGPDADSDSDSAGAALEFIGSWPLSGKVESMAALPASRPGFREALLLCFADAKLSVLEWSVAQSNLRTTSLHRFDGNIALKQARAAFPHGVRVRCDPLGRCAAVIMFDSQLALVPAFGKEGDDEDLVLGLAGGAQVDAKGAGARAGDRGAVMCDRSYVLDLGRLGVTNVRDVAFLHKYSEPTLLVLYEEHATAPALLPRSRDTCCVVAVSIDTGRRSHPRLWSQKGLPSDAQYLMATPSGGALVVCQSMALFVSQGQPPDGIVLSSAAVATGSPAPMAAGPSEMHFAVAAQQVRAHAGHVPPDVVPSISARFTSPPKTALDVDMWGSTGSWLTDSDALIALRDGRLLALTMRIDGSRVRGLDAHEVASAPVVSAACTVPSRCLAFLASRSGDSLLLRYSRKDTSHKAAEGAHGDVPPPPPPEDAPGQEQSTLDEEMELYGMSLGGTTEAAASRGDQAPARKRARLDGTGNFQVTVLDSLVNIGPIKDAAVGPGPDLGGGSSRDLVKARQQLVACVGHGRSGALAILRQSFEPRIVSNLDAAELKNIEGVWALRHRGAERVDEPPYDTALLMSTPTGIRAFETSKGLRDATSELRFGGQVGTLVAAAAIAGGSKRTSVIVHTRGLELLEGLGGVASMTVEQLGGGPKDEVLSASIKQGHVLLVLGDGRCALVRADPEASSLVMAEVPRDLADAFAPRNDGITAACLYEDETGWAATLLEQEQGVQQVPGPALVALSRQSGSLDIYAARSGRLLLHHDRIHEGDTVMAGARDKVDAGQAAEAGAPSCAAQLLFESFGPCRRLAAGKLGAYTNAARLPAARDPVLVAALSDGMILIYRAFMAPVEDSEAPKRTLAFRRVHAEVPRQAPPSGGTRAQAQLRRCLVRTDDVGSVQGCAGVFVCGPAPTWMIASRGQLVAHPVARCYRGGSALSMAPFHSSTCPHGFIVTSPGGMSVCEVPRLLRMGTKWTLEKVQTKGGDPIAVCCHAPARLYAVGLSRVVPYAQRWLPYERKEGSDPMASAAYALAEETARRRQRQEVHGVRLMTADLRQSLFSLDLDPCERILTLQSVTLGSSDPPYAGAPPPPPVPYILIGTARVFGEDFQVFGRLILVEVSRRQGVSAEEEMLGHIWAANITVAQELSGAITSVRQLGRYVAVSVGNVLEVYQLAGGGSNCPLHFRRRAFYERSQWLSASLSTLGPGYIAAADVHRGIRLMAYEDTPEPRLEQMGMNMGVMQPHGVALVRMEGRERLALSGDAGQCVQVWRHSPTAEWGGQQLLCQGQVYVGQTVHAWLPAPPLPPGAAQPTATAAALGCTLDGGLVTMVFLSQEAADLLRSLQERLATGLVHTAGLNPRSFRGRAAGRVTGMMQGTAYVPDPGPDSIVDGDLVARFLNLSRAHQARVCQEVGRDRAEVDVVLREVIAACAAPL